MKRLLVVALMLALVFSFSACGGLGGGSGTSGATSQSGGTSGAVTTSASGVPAPNGGGTTAEDLTTIEGWLAAFGLTENDLKCAHYNRLDINSHVISTGKITEVGAFVSEKLTDDEVKVWLDQIIAKLNSLSDSGQVDRLMGDGEALTADYIMAQTMYIGAGSYTYNGKAVSVMIAVMPSYLDSDDPDDAMAACSLGLEWR